MSEAHLTLKNAFGRTWAAVGIVGAIQRCWQARGIETLRDGVLETHTVGTLRIHTLFQVRRNNPEGLDHSLIVIDEQTSFVMQLIQDGGG